MQTVKAAALFKVLSDPTRLQLLYLVAENSERLCCVDLSEALAVSAPTVTHHMKKLADANLVTRHKRGKWAYYEIVNDEFARVHELIRTL